MDLFENYTQQPENLKEILKRYEEMDNCYIICGELLKEVEAIGYTFEFGLDAQPSNLHKESKLETAKRLWEILGDVPCDEENDSEIEEPFQHFPIGTDKMEIWHWFEEEFNLSVAEDLMFIN